MATPTRLTTFAGGGRPCVCPLWRPTSPTEEPLHQPGHQHRNVQWPRAPKPLWENRRGEAELPPPGVLGGGGGQTSLGGGSELRWKGCLSPLRGVRIMPFVSNPTPEVVTSLFFFFRSDWPVFGSRNPPAAWRPKMAEAATRR